MRRASLFCFLLGSAHLLLGAAASRPSSQPTKGAQNPKRSEVVVLTVVDAIHAGTADYIETGIQRASKQGADLLILELDTPGGMLQSTRDIVKSILNAPLPVVVFVTPSGARAGSAGVFITMAGHVAAMSPATNIGAAHPIVGNGKDPEKAGGKHLAKKIENDTVAFIEGIAKQRNKNVAWARKAVLDSVSVTATEALRLNVIDVIARDVSELLYKIDGKRVQVRKQSMVLATRRARVRTLNMSFKQRVISFFANPNIAYLLMMFGFAGIMMEIYHPGAIFPGVLGAICLFVGFVAMQVLPVNYGGLALIILGLLLLVAELFTSTFGLLFVGGLVSLTVGSIFLIDSPDPSIRLSLGTILPTVICLGVMAGAALIAVARAYRQPVKTGAEGMVGAMGFVRHALTPRGTVRIGGEQWNAVSADGQHIAPDTKIRVTKLDGLVVTVEPDRGRP